MTDEANCPGENCKACSGEYCYTHFNQSCDCDVIERHELKPQTRSNRVQNRSQLIPASILAEYDRRAGRWFMAGTVVFSILTYFFCHAVGYDNALEKENYRVWCDLQGERRENKELKARVQELEAVSK